MLSNYEVKIVREHEKLQVKVSDLGVYFVYTPSDEILDDEGKIRAKVFFLIMQHTFKNFFEEAARLYPGQPFDVVTYHESGVELRQNSRELAQRVSQLIQYLWGDGHLQGQSLVIAMGSLRGKKTGKTHLVLAGFTFRSQDATVYLMEGDNGVRGI